MGAAKQSLIKSKRKAPNAKQEFRFINYNLTTTDLDDLAEYDLETEFPLERSLELVAEGYKLSFSNDERNQSFICALTDKRESSEFFNACVTGRGATAYDAWCALAYRHFVVAADGWAALGDSPDRTVPRFG